MTTYSLPSASFITSRSDAGPPAAALASILPMFSFMPKAGLAAAVAPVGVAAAAVLSLSASSSGFGRSTTGGEVGPAVEGSAKDVPADPTSPSPATARALSPPSRALSEPSTTDEKRWRLAAGTFDFDFLAPSFVVLPPLVLPRDELCGGLLPLARDDSPLLRELVPPAVLRWLAWPGACWPVARADEGSTRKLSAASAAPPDSPSVNARASSTRSAGDKTFFFFARSPLLALVTSFMGDASSSVEAAVRSVSVSAAGKSLPLLGTAVAPLPPRLEGLFFSSFLLAALASFFSFCASRIAACRSTGSEPKPGPDCSAITSLAHRGLTRETLAGSTP